jgi:hypothetical protein
MAVATVGTARLTSDPVTPEQLKSDIGQLFDALAEGGIGLVPLDVAYAVIATTPSGIRRIFEVKRRSYEKPSGMFGNWRMSRDIHLMDDRRHAMVREIIEQERIPFSVVAPFRADHPLFAAVDPFVLQNSSKGGTLDMLLNAGQFHDAVAEGSLARGVAVFGSSANLSLTAASIATRMSISRSAMLPPSTSTTANRNMRTRMGFPAPSSTLPISPSSASGTVSIG